MLLILWLSGNVEKAVFENDSVSEYLSKNSKLKSIIRDELRMLIDSPSSQIDHTIHAEIDDGYSAGYQLLHGTNETVGGFNIKGARSEESKDGELIYKFRLKYTWNDIIDPNYTYIIDDVLTYLIKCFLTPKDYIIKIIWSGESTIKICNEKVKFEGYAAN